MKTLQDKKKCIIEILKKLQDELAEHISKIENVTKESDFTDIIEQLQQKNNGELNRKILECLNNYTSEEPYKRPL